MEYTPNQQAAIDFSEGNLQIIACAGSGKTDVISRRIAKLIAGGVKPENCLSFTFTEKAAEELKFRVRRYLEEMCPDNSEIGEMYIGTIHSFCFELLKDLKPFYRSFDVLDEHTRVLFLSEYGNYHSLRLHDLCDQSGVNYRLVRDFIQNVDVLRDEMIDVNEFPEDCSDEVYNTFRESYRRYCRLMEDERLLDFSSMISLVVDLMENDEDFLQKVRDKYQYVTVDEYQDINPLQERLINLICDSDGNLCVVGDDDQAIYQWRGTNVKNILEFRNRYDEVTSVSMVDNFRSTEGVINSARIVICENSERLDKDMCCGGNMIHEPGDVYNVFFDDMSDEIDFLVNKIKDLRGTVFRNNRGEEFTLDYRDMVILLRSVKTSVNTIINEEGQTLTDVLEENNIDYVIQGGGQLFSSSEVMLAVSTLAYITGYSYRGYGDLDSLGELYAEVFGERGNVDGFLMKVEDRRGSLEPDSWISLQEELQSVMNYMGVTDFEFTEVQMYNLGMLSQVISDFEIARKKIKAKAFKYFLGYVRAYAESQYEEGGNDDPTLVNAVKIMTIHRAKGLEFPVVFMPNLVSGRFPPRGGDKTWFIPTELFDVDRYEGCLEDERRLFYVAITRSQKFLFLTGARKTYSLKRDKSPSIFFNEFPEGYALTSPEPDPTDRVISDIEITEPLRNFPTSYSDLRYYDRCPYDYKLRCIYGFNPGVVMALGYGRNVHNVLNILHNDFRDTIPSADEVEDIVYNNFFMRYAPEAYAERFRKSITKLVGNYVDRHAGDFNLVLEAEKSFEFSLGNGLISGNIDLIKKLDAEGNLEGIEIVDFKNREDTELATDYEKQLKLYAIASLRSLGLNPKKATVHHLDDDSLTEVNISPGELGRVEDEVKDEILNITRRNFPKNPGSSRCRKCDFKLICNHREG